jgi:DNA-binding NarL/FixJ family response regulator
MDSTPTPPAFTRFQRRVLWHLSQGYTVKGTAEQLTTVRQSVVDSLVIIRRKAGAATTTQAVLNAYLMGAYGPRENCGTRAAYLRHLEAEEDACPACRRANAYWLKCQADPPVEVLPLTDAQLKIIRAFHIGRTHTDLIQVWRISRSRLHREIADMYRRLGVTEVSREERREAALQIAMERGLLRPGAPAAQSPVRSARVHLTQREKDILRAVDGGRSLVQAASLLGMGVSSLSSRLTDIYRKLDVSYLPRKQKRAAALREARARGYAV